VAVLIIFFVLAVLIGFAVTLAVGWIVIIPVLVALAVLAWTGTAFVMGRTPSDMVRRARRPELLGPGGPDDPDRLRR
jgi:hypothetical protein